LWRHFVVSFFRGLQDPEIEFVVEVKERPIHRFQWELLLCLVELQQLQKRFRQLCKNIFPEMW
jgi:hypothetical protein